MTNNIRTRALFLGLAFAGTAALFSAPAPAQDAAPAPAATAAAAAPVTTLQGALAEYTTAKPSPADTVLAPFPIDHYQRGNSAIDARFAQDGPAGSHGFIKARNGHLYYPDGKRFRCWGSNLTGFTPGGAEIPPHDAAIVFAAELARLGYNCVRLHFLDMPDRAAARTGSGARPASVNGPNTPVGQSPVGLIDASRPDTSHFNPQQLDNLDFFFNELKKQGIYADINLNVGHTWKEGDNIPDAKLIGVAKAYTQFGPELIAHEKEYARMLLDHKNPYTGTRYADDPAVVIVEIINENSMLEFWMRNWFRGDLKPDAPRLGLDLTPHYKALLTRLYNDWLKQTRTPQQLTVIHRLSGIPDGQDIPILQRAEFKDAPKERFYAESEFYSHIESSFLFDMRDYLVRDLGVKANIMATADHTYFIPGQPLLRTTQHFVINDAHVYWQHPSLWAHRNTPMVNEPLRSIVQRLSRTAMANHPFVVSEVNEPFPSDYDSEQIPVLAAYAALQDWDGVFFYTFESKVKDKTVPFVEDHFNFSEHPNKIAEMPVGAAIFLRGDVKAARQIVTRSYSAGQIHEMIRTDPYPAYPSFTPGYPANLPLVHGTRISCLECKTGAAKAPPLTSPIVSDTGEIVWRVHEGKDGLVSVDTDRSQALVGFIRANGADAATHNMAPKLQNSFATVTLTSLDGRPIDTSNEFLLTTLGKVENTGSQWDQRRAMFAKWGGPPSLIEPISGFVEFRNLLGSLTVTAIPLDGSARPIGEIHARQIDDGWELPIGTVPTTSYIIHVAR